MEMQVLGFSAAPPHPTPRSVSSPGPTTACVLSCSEAAGGVRLLARLALSGTRSTSNSAFSPSPWTPLSFPCHRAPQNWELGRSQGAVNISDAL